MNRRHFLGQVLLGSAAVSSLHRATLGAQQPGVGLSVNFVGMMYYATRSDRSLLVALPGLDRMGHYPHVTFLMARSGSAIAQALGLLPMPGVVAGAFDNRLTDAPTGGFVYRCLDGIDLEIDSGGSAVDHRATHLARMDRIAPGKRLRGDLRRWSNSTIQVRGGRLDNAAAHPDAGKIWSFGNHAQPLTDATLYRSGAATVRLSAGSSVDSFSTYGDHTAELWVVSAAGPRSDAPNPKRLEHSHLLFEFLSDAEPIIPTCAAAEGRITLPTELPCTSTAVASTRGGFTGVAPPHMDLCYGGGCCD